MTTKESKVGPDVDSEASGVIDNIVQSLHTAQEISKYIQKYDGQKWSVISIPFSWGSKYPEIYATMSIGGTYVAYHKTIIISDRESSAIIYV